MSEKQIRNMREVMGEEDSTVVEASMKRMLYLAEEGNPGAVFEATAVLRGVYATLAIIADYEAMMAEESSFSLSRSLYSRYDGMPHALGMLSGAVEVCIGVIEDANDGGMFAPKVKRGTGRGADGR